MIGIKYSSLTDLNIQSIKWNNKVNKKTHQTINQIPFERLRDEHLSPLPREYIIDKINMIKVEKDCLISYGGNRYSVPAEYVHKHVTVVALDNTLTIYYLSKQIVLHKNTMNVNKNYYKSSTVKQTFDTQNTLFINTEIVDFDQLSINLEVYDCE